MKKKGIYNHPTVFLLIMLIVMSVLVNQTAKSFVKVSGSIHANKTSESGKEAPASQESFNVSQDVILSVSSIHLDQEFYQIKEIVFGDENKEIVPFVVERFTSFFRTLFRLVISPNAP